MRSIFGFASRDHKRSVSNVVLVAVLALGLPVAGVTIAQAAEPSIAFLNPSSFADPGTERGIIVSDSPQNAGAGCCESDDGYRLSAWVSGAPAGYSVFFVASQMSARVPVEDEIFASNGGAGDTWEARWDIPLTFRDGPARIEAYAVVGGEIIASVSQEVTLQHVQGTETTRLTYPDTPGDPFGTFQPLATKKAESGSTVKKAPVGVVDHHYTLTENSAFVVVFYSTTPSGQTPEWFECGNNPAQAVVDFAADGTKCELVDPNHRGEITAIAAVTNDSPGQVLFPEKQFHQSGDATSVIPYDQTLQALTVVANQYVKEERGVQSQRFSCSDKVILELTDQVGRKIASANIDMRAEGPSDSLKFNDNAVLSAGQPPDQIPHRTEEAYDCLDGGASNSSPGQQGEVQKLGAPDLKLLEAGDGGTDELGQFKFQFFSETSGTTRWTAWVDEIDNGCRLNDDRYTFGELVANGGVQWATPEIPGPAFVPETITECSASPDPSPSESPTGQPSPQPTATEPPEPEERTISLSASDSRPRRDVKISLVGQLESRTNVCETDQAVKVKVRRPGGRFHLLTRTRTSSSARYSVQALIKGARDFRAVAIANEGCLKARSPIVEVRPRG